MTPEIEDKIKEIEALEAEMKLETLELFDKHRKEEVSNHVYIRVITVLCVYDIGISHFFDRNVTYIAREEMNHRGNRLLFVEDRFGNYQKCNKSWFIEIKDEE